VKAVAEFPYFRRHRGLASAAAKAGGRSSPALPDALRRALSSINIWFWAIVGLPTIVAAVYFFGLASDLYMSEVEFVVRSPSKSPSIASIGELLSGAVSSPGVEDTDAVMEYIMSRDAVSRLEAHSNLRAVLHPPGADLISRFPGLLSFGRTDFEALFKAYSRFVSVEIDSQSGIATLEVKAYRAQDAQAIAHDLLSFGEQLVNEMNERARQDALKTFQQEVSAAQTHIEAVQAKLTAYRMQQNMLDPKSAATGPLELVAKLIAQQTAAQTQLADLMKNSSRSPQIPLIKTRIASLGQAIEEERGKITGANNSVVSAQSEYERLTVELGLDEKALAAAFASLESARLEAQRQQLYLETIVQPNLPDYPLYPRRIVSFLVFTVSCLLIYGIAWLLAANVREHASA
jgi:capsular polysaccharide transport system permease protein